MGDREVDQQLVERAQRGDKLFLAARNEAALGSIADDLKARGALAVGKKVFDAAEKAYGVDRYAVAAIYSHDYPVIQCFALLMVVIFVLCNLVVDILAAALDPRIRLS